MRRLFKLLWKSFEKVWPTELDKERRLEQWLFVLLLIGFTTAIGVALLTGSYIIDHEKALFEQIADHRNNRLESHIAEYTKVVESVAALFVATDHLTLQDFQTFSDIELKNYQSILAIEWVPVVKASDREAWEAEVNWGHEQFPYITERDEAGNLTRSSQRAEYFPIFYIEPLAINIAAIGFDLGSNKLRREALINARDTGNVILTNRLQLMLGDSTDYGALIIMPVYNGAAPQTLEERRELIAGFAVAVIEFKSLFIFENNSAEPYRISDFLYEINEDKSLRTILPFAETRLPVESNFDFCIGKSLAVVDRQWLSVHCMKATAAYKNISIGVFIAIFMITCLLVIMKYRRAGASAAIRKSKVALKSSENRFNNLIQHSAIMVQVMNLDTGRLVSCNDNWFKKLGYGKDELPGLSINSFLHTREIAYFERLLQEAVDSGNSIETNTILLSKDGTKIYVRGSILVQPDDDGRAVSTGIFVDVTAGRKAEMESQAIAWELRQLIDTANAPIIGCNRDGLINEWNHKMEQITGYKKSEVIDKDLIKNYVPEDNQKQVTRAMRNALHGMEVDNFEFQINSVSGKRIDLMLNKAARRNAAGEIVGVIGVGQDLTDLKIYHNQIIQASKLATLGEMATSVAHELNQPLNVIRLAAANIKRKLAKKGIDAAFINAKLDRIDDQTERATHIIDHMRMFGRKAVEEFRPLDLKAVVTSALDMMGEQLRLSGIDVILELEEDYPKILGHNIQLEQVLLNLLNNSRDAMLDLSQEDNFIMITLLQAGDVMEISVEDNGGGISEENLARVFEPFFTTKEMTKGTGLGLSVSYGIIRDMGGEIDVENTDKGAKFTIRLPTLTISED